MSDKMELLREAGYIGKAGIELLSNTFLVDELKELGRLTRKNQLWATNYCNSGNESYFEKIEKYNAKINLKVEQLNQWFKDNNFNLKLRAEFQNDPRGNTAKIFIVHGNDEHGFQLWELLK